jgi:hypothetical protein
MSRAIFDDPAWWRRPRAQRAVALVATITAVAVWWIALAPVAPEPIVPRVSNATAAAPPAATSVRAHVAPPSPVAASAAASSTAPKPALSTMVAPGVHITPLSVPGGTDPVPAGPRAHDSEAEN